MTTIPVLLTELDLQPGTLYLSRDPAILRTVLGSCVGITFWHARLGIGALCHSALPKYRADRDSGPDKLNNFRYVDLSIRYLAGQFDVLGASRSELIVKLFGGADVLPVRESNEKRPTVGYLNCISAIEVLAEEGLKVSASDLGGMRGRKIRFNTISGEVLLQRLPTLIES
jgi:chemotaxis protein CheD